MILLNHSDSFYIRILNVIDLESCGLEVERLEAGRPGRKLLLSFRQGQCLHYSLTQEMALLSGQI